MNIPPPPNQLALSSRDTTVDIAKGIGIILVVAMHSGIGFLPAVDMPLFFLISGFFAPISSKYSVWDSINRKSESLLKLTFLYILFFSIFPVALAEIPQTGLAFPSIFHWLTVQFLFLDPFFYQPFQPFAAPLWFVPTLFCGMIIWILTRNFLEKWSSFTILKKIEIVTILFLILTAALRSPNLDENRFVGWFSRALYAYCFICFGFILYHYKSFLLYGKGKYLLLTLSIVAILFKLNILPGFLGGDIRSMTFSHQGRYWTLLISFSGIALVFVTASFIRQFTFLTNIFIYLGKQSFHIMALHVLGQFILLRLPLKYFNIQGSLNQPTLGILLLITGVVFSCISIKIISTIKSTLAKLDPFKQKSEAKSI